MVVFKDDKIGFIFESSLSESRSVLRQVDDKTNYYVDIVKVIASGFNEREKRIDSISKKLLRQTKHLEKVSFFSFDDETNLPIHLMNDKYNYIEGEKGALQASHTSKNVQLIYGKSDEGGQVFKIIIPIASKRNDFVVTGEINSDVFSDIIHRNSSFQFFLVTKAGLVLNSQTYSQRIRNRYLVNESRLDSKISNYVSRLSQVDGVFENLVNKEDYLISFNKLKNSNFLIYSFYSKSKALRAMDVFIRKSYLTLAIIFSLAFIMSIFLSKSLTRSIDYLFIASKKVEKGDYNIDIPTTSNDEIGAFSRQFVNMTKEVRTLLNKIKKHNEELEQKVEERTQEVRNISKIQQAMVDSVDQGFFIFDENSKVGEIYSKVAENIFSTSLENKNIFEVLNITDKEEISELNEIIELIFSNSLPFKEGLSFFPQYLKTKKNKDIYINYFPLLDEKKLKGIVAVASDKTDEMNALENAKVQKSKVDMILEISNNKKIFEQLFSSCRSQVYGIKENLDKGITIKECFILLHTMKGNLAGYGLPHIVESIHLLESALNNAQGDDVKTILTQSDLDGVLNHMNDFIEEYEELLGLSLKSQSSQKYEISLDDLKAFETTLKRLSSDESVLRAYRENILYRPVDSIVAEIVRKASNVAKQLNKDVAFKVNGEDTRLDLERFEGVFETMVHVTNNAVDHGIESGEQRVSLGKSIEANVIISFIRNGKKLQFSIEDDGGGIDVEKLRDKFKLPESMSDAEARMHIFESGVSTRSEVSMVSGRGVGLSAFKNEVDKLGGKITIVSKKNIGTIVSIEFEALG